MVDGYFEENNIKSEKIHKRAGAFNNKFNTPAQPKQKTNRNSLIKQSNIAKTINPCSVKLATNQKRFNSSENRTIFEEKSAQIQCIRLNSQEFHINFIS